MHFPINIDQYDHYLHQVKNEKVLQLARKTRLHVAIGDLNFRCLYLSYYFTSFTIVFSMSCLLYIASS